MKTYILSVNTLMWKLTSERHDNCAPCLGLILPIRWVTPPPNFSVWSVSLMVLFLQCLRIWSVFNFNLSSWFSSLCWFDCFLICILVFCPLQHSLIAMSSCWIFWTKWMWSDPNLSMLTISKSICPNHMHSIETVECLLCILVSRRHRDKHQVLFKWFIFIVDIWRSRNNHLTNLAGTGTWENSEYVACLPRAP